jgi:hypothetical protein
MFRRQVEWWYWLATVVPLSAGLAGYPAALAVAIGLTAIQIFHFAVRSGGVATFPVQVRAAYLALLLLGLWPPLSILHWVQFVGTWAMVLADYCFLARCLSLLPWNRRAPLTARHVASTFFSRPVKGNILQGLPADEAHRWRHRRGQEGTAPGSNST